MEQNLEHRESKELVWFLFLLRVFRTVMENYQGN